MNHDAKAVANAFYKLAKRDRQKLTNMQIQKLVYIAHGFTLAMRGEPLIADVVEAWPYGPVVPPLYEEYKDYGADAIGHRLQTRTKPIQEASREYRSLEVVWASYSRYSGPELSALTHKPDTPWFQVWFPEKRKRVIPNSVIQVYYRQFLQSPEPVLSAIPALEQAAALGDKHTFTGLLKEIDWANNPDADLGKMVSLAFEVGAPTAAKFIYDRGTRHGMRADLQRFARLFPSQRIAGRTSRPIPTLKANRAWLQSHREQYRGQWIALRDGELLAVAPSLEDLRKKIGDVASALLTRA